MENSNLAVVLTFKRSFKIHGRLTLHVRGFAYMFPQKEKLPNFSVFTTNHTNR